MILDKSVCVCERCVGCRWKKKRQYCNNGVLVFGIDIIIIIMGCHFTSYKEGYKTFFVLCHFFFSVSSERKSQIYNFWYDINNLSSEQRYYLIMRRINEVTSLSIFFFVSLINFNEISINDDRIFSFFLSFLKINNGGHRPHLWF